MKLVAGILLTLIAGAVLAASPNGTVVLAGQAGSIISNDGTVWTLSSATAVPAAGVQVVRNGKTQTNTAHIVEIAWVNGVIWQNGGGTWRPLPYPTATYWGVDNINPLLTLPTAQTCGVAPATTTQTMSCPTGFTGSWVQTTTWASAAAPTCWTAVLTPPSAPSGACTPVVTPPTAQAILTWSAVTQSTSGVTLSTPVTYNIYQGTSAGSLSKVASGLIGLTTTLTAGLSTGNTYYWSVSATAASVEGAQSNIGSKAL